jgi:hypothetical protein
MAISAEPLLSCTFTAVAVLTEQIEALTGHKDVCSSKYTRSKTLEHEHSAIDVSRRVLATKASFRAPLSYSALSNAQSGFDDFCDGRTVDGSALPLFLKESLYRPTAAIDPYLFSEGCCAFSEAYLAGPTEATATKHLIDVQSSESLLSDRSNAAQRLSQLSRHLQKSSTSLDRNRYRDREPFQDLLLGGLRPMDVDRKQELQDLGHLARSAPRSSLRIINARHQQSQDIAPELSAEPAGQIFQCDYAECNLRLLEMQRLNHVSCMPRPRPCVHQGCGFRTESVQIWTDHVYALHHR